MSKVRVLVEGSMMIALAVVLEFVFKQIPLFQMPQGGHVSLTMLPLMVYAYRNGLKEGLLAGTILGFINFLMDGYGLHWGTLIFDYFLAFGALGVVGLAKRGSLQKMAILMGVAGSLRWLMHVASGVLFFGDYAPEGTPVLTYSLADNTPYMLLSTILCIVVAFPLYRVFKS